MIAFILAFCLGTQQALAKPWTWVSEKKPQVVLVVPERLLKPGNPKKERRDYQERLRLSIQDFLQTVLEMSRVEVPVQSFSDWKKEPIDLKPIFLAESAPAQDTFSNDSSPMPGQSFVLDFTHKDYGVIWGDSDLAISYGLYTLLREWGAGWYFPGELGRHVPENATLSVQEARSILAPATFYRDVWYADNNYRRWNRCGGERINTRHQLERLLTKEQKNSHPEFIGQVQNKPYKRRLHWTAPGLINTLASNIKSRLRKKKVSVFSLSPDDGQFYDDSKADRAWDTGDIDPVWGRVSLTDRYLRFITPIIKLVTAEFPDQEFGMLAYVRMVRPPVEQEVPDNLWVEFAPIEYSRTVPVTSDQDPNNARLRSLFKGWSKKTKKLLWYGYAWNLASPSGPHPMLNKIEEDFRYAYRHGVRAFSPETITNFETTAPGLYFGLQLAWNPEQTREKVMGKYYRNLYGAGAQSIQDYWNLVDALWSESAVAVNGAQGMLQRFPREAVESMGQALKKVPEARLSTRQYQRFTLLKKSYELFHDYMDIRWSFQEGKLKYLGGKLAAWRQIVDRLAKDYAPNDSFGLMPWTKGKSYYRMMFDGHYGAIMDTMLDLYQRRGAQAGFRQVSELDLSLYNQEGTLLNKVGLVKPGETALGDYTNPNLFLELVYVYQWEQKEAVSDFAFALSNVDGSVKVSLDGKDWLVEPSCYFKTIKSQYPGTLKSGSHTLTIKVKRDRFHEAGSGGLLGPVWVTSGKK